MDIPDYVRHIFARARQLLWAVEEQEMTMSYHGRAVHIETGKMIEIKPLLPIQTRDECDGWDSIFESIGYKILWTVHMK